MSLLSHKMSLRSYKMSVVCHSCHLAWRCRPRVRPPQWAACRSAQSPAAPRGCSRHTRPGTPSRRRSRGGPPGHDDITYYEEILIYLVTVAHRLYSHAEHLIGQGVTPRVHHLFNDVDYHVHLLDGVVAEHVWVGGDVVRQVGAVPGLERNTLPRERSIQQTTHIKARGHLSFGLLVEHSLSVRLQMVSPLSL